MVSTPSRENWQRMRQVSRSEEERKLAEVGRDLWLIVKLLSRPALIVSSNGEVLTMTNRISRVNPVAKAMMQGRRRTQVVPNKKKYDRKRDKHAGEDRQVPHKADKQTADD